MYKKDRTYFLIYFNPGDYYPVIDCQTVPYKYVKRHLVNKDSVESINICYRFGLKSKCVVGQSFDFFV